MNTYLHSVKIYFEHVIHPAAGKNDAQKTKRRNSQTSYALQASPDCLNIRAAVRSQNNVRRNPAP
jgi:hypothetical protein